MKVLILGSGGREHALAWAASRSARVSEVVCAPGNGGMQQSWRCIPVNLSSLDSMVAAVEAERPDLTVVGPELPLSLGIVDALRGRGLPAFGPSREAAKLESSKGFAKRFLQRHNIPTAHYALCANRAELESAIERFHPPIVVKADGLAAGKGVIICESRATALEAADSLFSGSLLGTHEQQVVVEEFLEGDEISFLCLTDGKHVAPLVPAQDHKRIGEGDTGPNTGGMGAYSPARILTPELRGEVMSRIIAPTVHAMADAGMPYSGVLYAGLMLTAGGPKLVEYNCRFGDPECQVLMMRLESDLGEYLLACAENRLATMPRPKFSSDMAVTVVMAANGYPGTPEKGGPIAGIEAAEANGAKIFQAGTELAEGHLVVNGGRVLNVTATGGTVAEAQAKAYAAVDAIAAPSLFCRRDIGWREIARHGS